MKRVFAILALSGSLLLLSGEAFAQDAAVVAELVEALEETQAILRDAEEEVQTRGGVRPRGSTLTVPGRAINIVNENLALVRRPTQAGVASPPKSIPVPASQQSQLQQLGVMVARSVPTGLLQSRWGAFVAAGESPMDINSLIQQVLREAYLQTTKDLRFNADKVRFYNNMKKQIRAQIQEARAQISRSRSTEGLTTHVEWEAKIRSLEEQLSAVGDDAQLANLDLQATLQKQQQMIQAASNVSKMLHDTAMAIIRKIG